MFRDKEHPSANSRKNPHAYFMTPSKANGDHLMKHLTGKGHGISGPNAVRITPFRTPGSDAKKFLIRNLFKK